MRISNLLFLLVGTFVCASVCAQTAYVSESTLRTRTINSAINQIDEPQKAVYSGKNYVQYFVSKGNDGHPYFSDTRAEYIVFDDIQYNTVKFVYDIFLDEIVVFTPDSNWITPPKEKISAFSFGGRKHERFDSIGQIQAGFYEIVFKSDKATLLSKTRKLFRASVWTERVTYYLVTSTGYELESKKDLAAALSDRETEIRAFLRNEKLSFNSKNKGASFLKVVRYYSTLK